MARKKLDVADRIIQDFLTLQIAEAQLLLKFLGAALRLPFKPATPIEAAVGIAVAQTRKVRQPRVKAPSTGDAGVPAAVMEVGEDQ